MENKQAVYNYQFGSDFAGRVFTGALGGMKPLLPTERDSALTGPAGPLKKMAILGF